MKHKRGSKNSHNFSSLCGLTWEDFYEESIDLSLTIEKVRFHRKDGTPFTVEFTKSSAPEISRPYYLEEILTGLFDYILGCNEDVARAFIDIMGAYEDALSFQVIQKPNPHIPFEMILLLSQAMGTYTQTYDSEDESHMPLDWPDRIFFGLGSYEEFVERLERTKTNARIISELPL